MMTGAEIPFEPQPSSLPPHFLSVCASHSGCLRAHLHEVLSDQPNNSVSALPAKY
ncbi:MAG: hypothetical protein K0S10_3191 [Rubrobacteraceae bacterium]|jgi:hypothetical protein|nr:hypothetical protein [Rubrobacteraceae bacterium]